MDTDVFTKSSSGREKHKEDGCFKSHQVVVWNTAFQVSWTVTFLYLTFIENGEKANYFFNELFIALLIIIPLSQLN